jgi:hypothetical protein
VCVTKGAKDDDSYVRREIGYALALGKPIIPLIADGTLPPISIINLTRIDFLSTSFESAMAELEERFNRAEPEGPAKHDYFAPYLKELYKRIVGFIEQTVVTSTELAMDATKGADSGQRPGHSFDMLEQLFIGHGLREKEASPRRFLNFREAFCEYQGRILVLGAPGSGKTTTLMAHARDAVAARLEDLSLPVPLVGVIATWNPNSFSSLAYWLAAGHPHLDHAEVQSLLDRGGALLLLDGLDELPEKADPTTHGPGINPRVEFSKTIPQNNKVVVSCRVEDFSNLGITVALNGAVMLQPLTDEQMATYLSTVPELLLAAGKDSEMRSMLSTPLIASLFARMYSGINDKDRKAMIDLAENPGDTRDAIIHQYIQDRYRWEERRLQRQGETPPFPFLDFQALLSHLAMSNAGTYRMNLNQDGLLALPRSPIMPNVILHRDLRSVVGDDDQAEISRFVCFARKLNLLISRDEASIGFAHLVIRDALAFSFSRDNLYNESLYSFYTELVNPAEAFGRTGGTRATMALIGLLKDASCSGNIHRCAAVGLGYTGTPLPSIL